MKMFEYVQASLDKVYKELTKSDRYPLGGSASLVLANQDDPFSGRGIQYNAMPPTKRFNDMDKLSGGEKTVAALALLFAINKCACYVVSVLCALALRVRLSSWCAATVPRPSTSWTKLTLRWTTRMCTRCVVCAV